MSLPNRSKRRLHLHHDIPTKANRVLNIILIAIILIITRVWHLAVVQYDQKVEESRKPQRKVVIEPAIRATIRDRFNLPLAINKIQYQGAILYSQLKDIPSIAWEKDVNGKKIKRFKRKEYIKQLTQLLAAELNLDAERLEDLIHAKASYYAQVPFVIKEELTEKEYYRLKILEKDWPGIYARPLPKRYYPRGRVAADVIGYMGAINRQEYEKILHEMKVLESFIKEKEEGKYPELPVGIENSVQARKRLKDLEEKAYTIHDYVGKAGIEGVFEQQLRGFYGKKCFYSDSKGNFLRELPGSKPSLTGHRLLLTISAELQEYAEQLLAQNEQLRVVRLSHLNTAKQTILASKHPWIKGGAIVAMEPQTGEVLTLASYPRFNPNDFILSGKPDIIKEKKRMINQWLENESHLADLWDQRKPLERERYDLLHQVFYDQQSFLSWDFYLDLILNHENPLRAQLNRVKTIEQAFTIQNEVEILQALYEEHSLYSIFNHLYYSEEHIAYPSPLSLSDKRELENNFHQHALKIIEIKRKLDPYLQSIPSNYDKVLLIDLCRLIVISDRFSLDLFKIVGSQSLAYYREMTIHFFNLIPVI
jgi:cell division protein FtsI/penicillin-binding protein 2